MVVVKLHILGHLTRVLRVYHTHVTPFGLRESQMGVTGVWYTPARRKHKTPQKVVVVKLHTLGNLTRVLRVYHTP